MSTQPELPERPDLEKEPDGATVRRRLARAFSPKLNRAQLLAGLLCAVLGFALVVQFRQTQDSSLENLRETDLVRILDDVSQRASRLEDESDELRSTRDQLLSSSNQEQVARQAAQERVDVLGVLAGTAPATGPGIQLVITDPHAELGAVTLLDAVQELRDAGAEAMQVGDVRIVASTSFVNDSDGVRVDGTLLHSPYVFQVIGDPKTLSPALGIPGGVLATVNQSQSGSATVTEMDEVVVDALRRVEQPQYARPAETPSATATP
ncbi:MAG TPA: DUF881 domain-containing protein [Actinomycetales bacterium]|jgi:uncharacterized protein YlxW (UPF0749 family)|nr:DUF881 domain-containing protein [Actinomycetales bacterium]